MKVLVISMLRLGDIVLATPILRALRNENPNCELHLLINGQFSSICPLIVGVDKFYSFDRDGFQEIMGSKHRNLLEAYYQVDELVQSLQNESYDKVINLTHNRLSGWMTSLINCPKTEGVVYNKGKFQVGSGWYQYLNDLSVHVHSQEYHFVDVFHYATGFSGAGDSALTNRKVELVESEKGRAFAEQILQKHKGTDIIYIQAFSNEEKKTLSLTKWVAIADTLVQIHPNAHVIFLGTEREIGKLVDAGVSAHFEVMSCDLEGAFSLLSRGSLLITCDTSIKHLASGSNIQVLEISLGSSNFRKTGVYRENSLIIQGAAPCAPCSHSKDCYQPRQYCADVIDTNVIASAAHALINRGWGELRTLARECHGEMEFYRVRMGSSGDWCALSLGREPTASEIVHWIDRSSQKLLLQKSHEQRVGEFGTEGQDLLDIFSESYPAASNDKLNEFLLVIEKSLMAFENDIHELMRRLRETIDIFSPQSLESLTHMIRAFSEKSARSKFTESYSDGLNTTIEELNGDSPFVAVKNLRCSLTASVKRSGIELKLVRGIQKQIEERKCPI